MICIKTVKSLNQDEIKNLNSLIDTYYTLNTLLQSEIVIYSKINDNDIIGCICVIPKKGIISNLCVKVEYWNMGIEKNLIQMAKNLAGPLLVVHVPKESILKTYYSKQGFISNGEQTMILSK